MKFYNWLERWNMSSLKVKTPVAEMEWKPQDADRKAAWDMYVEMLTRITTQPLSDDDGIEKTALESVYNLFGITRAILKHHGRECSEFAKLAIIILNQVIRPFTARWHKLSNEGAFDDPASCRLFKEELRVLQQKLFRYTQMLADIAEVEDLTSIEE
jgi:hypothetical protein